jgi:WD40 repeat protein
LTNGVLEGSPSLVRDSLEIETSFGLTKAGKLLYTAVSGGPVVSIAAIDPDSGKTVSAPQPVTERKPRPIQGDWSPDGSHVAFRSRVQGRELLSILTLDTGAIRTFNPPLSWISQLQWPSASSLLIRGEDLRGRSGLYQIDISSGKVTNLEVGECREERCPTGVNMLSLIHSVSSDFKSVFYALQPEPGSAGDRVMYIRDRSTGQERELLRGPGLFGFRVAPDGRRMTFIEPDAASKSNVLKVLSIDSGAVQEVYRTPDGRQLTNLLEWTPDGQRLLFGLADGPNEVGHLISVSGGAPVRLDLRLRAGTRDPYRAVRIHPDGRRLLLTSGSLESAEIWSLENFLPAAVKNSAGVAK